MGGAVPIQGGTQGKQQQQLLGWSTFSKGERFSAITRHSPSRRQSCTSMFKKGANLFPPQTLACGFSATWREGLTYPPQGLLRLRSLFAEIEKEFEAVHRCASPLPPPPAPSDPTQQPLTPPAEGDFDEPHPQKANKPVCHRQNADLRAQLQHQHQQTSPLMPPTILSPEVLPPPRHAQPPPLPTRGPSPKTSHKASHAFHFVQTWHELETLPSSSRASYVSDTRSHSSSVAGEVTKKALSTR